MTNIPNRQTFENAYAGKAPWDIGKPQPVFVAIAMKVMGSILDAGCGTGENALFFAQRGHKVTGIDYLPIAGIGAFTLTIAGFEYYIHPSVRFSPNVELVSYSEPVTGTKATKDTVARLTFYWVW